MTKWATIKAKNAHMGHRGEGGGGGLSPEKEGIFKNKSEGF